MLLTILDYIDSAPESKKGTSPRYHYDAHTDSILIEPSALSRAEKSALEALGHTIKEHQRKHWDLQVIQLDKITGNIETFSSPTGGGQAIVR